MAARETKKIRNFIKRFKPVTSTLSLHAERLGQDVLGKVTPIPHDIKLVEANVGDIPAEWVISAKAPSDKVLLYIHGGAYFSGSLVSNRLLSVTIAEKVGIKTFSFQYRLAPEHPFPAALEDAERVYDELLRKYNSQDIAFIGESAGGGLLVALALKLKDEGKPLPAALICMSPWTDLTLSGESYKTNEEKDILLTREKLERAAKEYAPCDAENPYVSPVFGDVRSLPPTLIQVGTAELLLDDARMLSDVMERADVDVCLEEWENMWHVWQAMDTPESEEALARIRRFVFDKLGIKD